MRVLLISHTCQSATEGQPKAWRLGSRPGIELRVVVPDRWKHYGKWRMADVPTNDNLPFKFTPEKVRFPWAGPAQFYLHFYPKLAAILREFQPDVIDLWEEPWGLVSAHACRLRELLLPHAKIVAETEQNIDKKLPFPFGSFRSFVMRRADHFIARSTEAANVLRTKGYTGPVTVVPNGVDTQLFQPMNRAACRQSLNLTGFTVGYVGRLVAEKGLLDLVDAVAKLQGVNVLFVGGGPLKSSIEQRAAELAVASRVRILEPQPLTALPAIMNALDCLVLPSHTTARWKEQFGRVLIEAGACGTPVIGSSSGAIPDVVGNAGLIFPEGDVNALAMAITQLRDDTAKREQMSAAGRRQAMEQFSWERVADQMESVYRQTMNCPAARPTGFDARLSTGSIA